MKVKKMAKEQRLIFIIADDKDGNMNVNCEFFPKLADTKEAYDKLTPNMQQMQSTASMVAKSVMDGFHRAAEDFNKQIEADLAKDKARADNEKQKAKENDKI